MVKSKIKVIAIVFSVVSALAIIVLAIVKFTCTDGGDDKDKGACVTHNFVRVEDSSNREPTYDDEGRELKKCSECGLSAYFIIPKLQRTDGTEAPEYIPLFDSYNVTYGDTLEKVASLYFTSGWAFTVDKESKVGPASEIGYDFAVRFTPADNRYAAVETSVKLIVKKKTLTESDIYLDAPLNIPSSVADLNDLPITLKSEQVVEGSIKWAEGQEILRNQSAYYSYIFTPNDTDNYEIFEGKLLLNA